MLESNCLKFDIIDIFREKRGKIRIRTNNKQLYTISCRLNGSSAFYTPNGEITVSRGDVLYVPQGLSYTQETECEDVIIVHLNIIGNPNRAINVCHTDFPDEICALFCELENVWREKKDLYAYSCMAMLYQLIAETGIGLSKQSPTQSLLYPGLQYINRHFSEPDFSLSVACQKCNISRTYFNRLFKAEKNMTPLEYIHQLKIQKAEMLLKSGSYTNEEISELCGFRDVKYFYVLLKKMTGNTTKVYKN